MIKLILKPPRDLRDPNDTLDLLVGFNILKVLEIQPGLSHLDEWHQLILVETNLTKELIIAHLVATTPDKWEVFDCKDNMSTKMVEFDELKARYAMEADKFLEARYCNEHYTITFFDPSWAFAGERSPVDKIPLYLGDYWIGKEDLELQVLLVRSRKDRIRRVEFKLKSIIKKEFIASFHKMAEQGQCGFILASFSDQTLLKNHDFTYKMALSSSESIDYTTKSLDIGSYHTLYFNKINKIKCDRLMFDKETNEAVMYFTAYQGF